MRKDKELKDIFKTSFLIFSVFRSWISFDVDKTVVRSPAIRTRVREVAAAAAAKQNEISNGILFSTSHSRHAVIHELNCYPDNRAQMYKERFNLYEYARI